MMCDSDTTCRSGLGYKKNVEKKLIWFLVKSVHKYSSVSSEKQ